MGANDMSDALLGGATVIREVVQCAECGVGGLDPVEDVCGDWIGKPGNGYRCPDILCRDCRGLKESDAD